MVTNLFDIFPKSLPIQATGQSSFQDSGKLDLWPAEIPFDLPTTSAKLSSMNSEFKIVEYKTAFGSSSLELDIAVMALLGVGFEPFGSPYVCNKPVEGVGGELAFFQAMVLTNKPRVTIREVASHEILPSALNVATVTGDDLPAGDVTR